MPNDRYGKAGEIKVHHGYESQGARRSEEIGQGGSAKAIKEINLDYWLLVPSILFIGFLTIAEIL